MYKLIEQQDLSIAAKFPKIIFESEENEALS